MTVNQKLEASIKRAAEILVDVGVGNWKVTLNSRRSSLAYTHYGKREISFSQYFLLAATKKQLEGVTYHEAAHALVGIGHGHGPVFKRKCFEISGNHEYSKATTPVGIARYSHTCPLCAKIWQGNRRRTFNAICPYCSSIEGPVFLVSKENPVKVLAW